MEGRGGRGHGQGGRGGRGRRGWRLLLGMHRVLDLQFRLKRDRNLKEKRGGQDGS
jgi:hypothetical protein